MRTRVRAEATYQPQASPQPEAARQLEAAGHAAASPEPAAPRRVSRFAFLRPGGFVWGLLLLGMLFYAIVFPFRSTFALEYFQGAKGLSLQDAGIANSWVFFAAIFASPVFGWIADRTRHKVQLLTCGMANLAASFYILAATSWPLWITTALVGLSYSLVPAVNYFVGWLNDQAGAGRANPAGYEPMMWLFGALSLLGALIGLWLSARVKERVVRVKAEPSL